MAIKVGCFALINPFSLIEAQLDQIKQRGFSCGDLAMVLLTLNQLSLASKSNLPNMKKIFLLSTLFVGILLISSCKKDPPVALFLMDKATFKMDEAITFTNQSENAKSYAWDFGDSKKSTDENPTHTYSSTGDFTIKLIATGGGGTDSISKTISVLQNLTGIWLKSLNYTDYGMKITGTMNITQHDDNTLTGSFVYDQGFGFPIQAIPLLPTSYILKDSVSIGWEGGTVFKGLINPNGKAMGGQLPADFEAKGTWVATKL